MDCHHSLQTGLTIHLGMITGTANQGLGALEKAIQRNKENISVISF